MMLASALFTLLQFGSPVSNTNPTAPAIATTAATMNETDYVVGVFVVYEDDTYETIEEKSVPAGLEFEVITSDGDISVMPEALNPLLERRHVTSFNGKEIKSSFSFLTVAGCTNDARKWFVYKCMDPSTPNPFVKGCFTPEVIVCDCFTTGNFGIWPCTSDGCPFLRMWCNGAN